MSDDSREENVYMAKLAEQAERYDEVHARAHVFESASSFNLFPPVDA